MGKINFRKCGLFIIVASTRSGSCAASFSLQLIFIFFLLLMLLMKKLGIKYADS